MDDKFDLAIQAKYKEADGIKALADSEERALSGDEIKNINALMDDVDSLKAQKAEAEQALKRLEAVTPAPSTIGAKAPKIEVGEPRFTKDPMAGFVHAQDLLVAVKDNGATPAKMAGDERLRFLADASDSMNTQEGTFGGFQIPTAMLGGRLEIDHEGDPTAGRCREVPMEARTVGIRARVDKDHTTSVVGGLVVERRAEMEKAKNSRQKTEVVSFTASSLDGLTYASDELLEDSPSTVAALLADFPAAFADKEFQEKLYGNGKGQFEGIMNTPSMITVSASGSNGDVNEVELAQMMSQCYKLSGAMWLANHDFLPKLITLGGDNKNIWQADARQGFSGTLYGLPLVLTEYLPSVGQTGDLVLANWSEYIIGNYGGTKSNQSIHVRFETSESTYKFTKANAARPWWRAQLKPKNGSNRSPFVKLGARA